ncbi:uncharacterized protein LOC122919528 [Bufo gargarizans]|uniref:uncharacterized protein LOC122919528 n=1 Tax=Bufo gargarizans TaxID=30331 RepID=UPI001CF1C1B0|nr:uncharacterized protein LOC122919528 [Bufo gargarizans]
MAHNHHHVSNTESEKLLQVQDQEGCPDPSPSTALIPKDSDFFPSVALAAALLLIFVSVLPLLSQSGTAFVPFQKLGNFSRKEANFHPLLYIQPRSTQLTLEALAKNHEENITVLAVAKEQATLTLLCFSKNVFSLLSKQSQGLSVIRQVMEDMRNNSNARSSEVFSVSVVTQRRGHGPHCTVLRPPSPVTGNVHLTEISSPQEKEVTEQRESFTIARELLELMYKTGLVPETFEVKGTSRHHVKVMHVLGDPYLESGIVC